MANPITSIQKYYGETVEQLRKCTWPTGKELYESTILIISAMVILTVFVMLADWISEILIRFITVGL